MNNQIPPDKSTDFYGKQKDNKVIFIESELYHLTKSEFYISGTFYSKPSEHHNRHRYYYKDLTHLQDTKKRWQVYEERNIGKIEKFLEKTAAVEDEEKEENFREKKWFKKQKHKNISDSESEEEAEEEYEEEEVEEARAIVPRKNVDKRITFVFPNFSEKISPKMALALKIRNAVIAKHMKYQTVPKMMSIKYKNDTKKVTENSQKKSPGELNYKLALIGIPSAPAKEKNSVQSNTIQPAIVQS